jgi:hypothetical protein
MPTVKTIGPYAFRFYSSDRQEPRHIHVVRSGVGIAKFWLDPLRIAYNKGYSSKEIKDIEQLVEDNADEFRQAWDNFFRP